MSMHETNVVDRYYCINITKTLRILVYVLALFCFRFSPPSRACEFQPYPRSRARQYIRSPASVVANMAENCFERKLPVYKTICYLKQFDDNTKNIVIFIKSTFN